MFAPLPRAKRQRSSSPPIPQEYIDLTSPLDILIKRRRREGGYSHDAYPFPEVEVALPSDNAGEGSSNWFIRPAAALNGRRSRQWQHLNAPSSSSISSSSTLPVSTSQPNPAHMDSSPFAIEHGRAHSQPDMHGARPDHHTHGHMMSSSPIRHEPPGSSPFRASGSSRVAIETETGVDQVGGFQVETADVDDEWDEDQLGREWGEYARENSVLYSIHRERHTYTGTPPHPHSSMVETPSRPASFHHTYNPQLHPTPYRDRPSSSASTHLPSSSPFRGIATPSDMTRRNYHLYGQDHDGDGDEGGMEVLGDGEAGREGEGDAEVRRRYEDANRLLAELAVARRRRWGES